MRETIRQLLIDVVELLKIKKIIPFNLPIDINVERTKNADHGDFFTNIAMILAKSCGKSPRVLAEIIVNNLAANASVIKVEIAGPGFINFFFNNHINSQVITQILQQKEKLEPQKTPDK